MTVSEKICVARRRVRAGVVTIGLVLIAVSGAHAEGNTAGPSTSPLETGAIKKDVRVAPVRRVFPKTPTDRELNRLSAAQTTKSKRDKKTKKR